MLEWLDEAWQRLNGARMQNRLPHALLIVGADGVGKEELAAQLAASLLCEKPDGDGQPCGQCSSCAWLRAGTHPDLLHVRPEEAGKAIKVDQVRELCAELGMTSHAGRYKVAIIQPADAMNVNAANSLLKTLEEPTDRTILILLTAAPGCLPATVCSRCQRIPLGLPEKAVALDWLKSRGVAEAQAAECLQLAQGAPLKALQLIETDSGGLRSKRLDQLEKVFDGRLDPVATAKDWAGDGERQSLEWWRTWLQDIIYWQQAGRQPAEAQVAQKLQRIVNAVDCRQSFKLLDRIANALNSIGTGLNQQLVLEDLLVSWATLARRAGK